MPTDPLNDPAIVNLLSEADAMRALIADLGADDPGDFRGTLEQIYTELGRTLHALVAPPLPAAAPRSTRSEDLAAREVETSRTSRRDAKRERLEARRAVQAQRQQRATEEESPEAPVPELITPAGAVVQEAFRAHTASGGEADGWITQLGDLLERIEMPANLDDPRELAAEASLVQWCTFDLDRHWEAFPVPIRGALLGLIAARARHLQDRLAVDVGPRIALERLVAYRERASLRKVEGLYPEREAQTGAWADDARKWWDTLVEGLQTA